MKTLKMNLIKYRLVLVLVLLTQLAQAQTDTAPTFDDDVHDVPVAPIDSWIIPLMVLALVGVFVYYHKQQKQIIK